MHITWREVIKKLAGLGIKVTTMGRQPQLSLPTKKSHHGLAINGRLPYSISEAEFNLMKQFIEKHDLKKGYELATGTCISTIGLGLGFKKTGGSLISMDSYMEEQTGSQPVNNSSISVSDGPLARNKVIIESYQLSDTVHLEHGSSPHSCDDIFSKHNFEKLDFVFFDCPKDASDYIRDLNTVKNMLAEKFVIFVHDTHCYPDEFISITEKELGITPTLIHEFDVVGTETKHYQYWPLAMITNIPGA